MPLNSYNFLSSRIKTKTCVLTIVAACIFQVCSGSVSVTTVGVLDVDSVNITAPPSFAIASYGYRHDLDASFDLFLNVVGPDGPLVYDYQYHYTALDNVEGMTVSEDGIVEFLPTTSQIGESYSVNVEITVSSEGSEVFTDTLSFTTRVIPEVPQFKLSPYPSTLYGDPRPKYLFGMNIELTDEDWDFFRFSLIDPPAGVLLISHSNNPAIDYPKPDFGEGITRVPIHLRYELDTLAGTISDEIEFVQELLPESTYWDSLQVGSSPGAFFGFAVASSEDWFIAGEPFIGDPTSAAPTGAVHLWRIEAETGNLINEAILTPGAGILGEAFGGSVAVRDSVNGIPPAAVVGAPEAPGGTDGLEPNVGRVDVFERNGEGTWEPVASLAPPQPAADIYAGGWVDISGDTIVASVEGADHAGPFSGALAIYQRNTDTEDWEWAQTLTAPDAGELDYFGYPNAIQSNWIAAAANEDDEAGLNAGAVHLFKREAGSFVHQQKILSPEPQADALFGERLELSGEWLFVSAFRQDIYTGAVYVYRLVNEIWTYHQRLEAPFITEYSGFGSALAVKGDTLSVSAPGNLAGPENYPWRGITLYRLIDDNWVWANHQDYSFSKEDALGFALAQITSHNTIAGVPFENLNQGRSLGGRVARFDWPVLTPETFESATEQLPDVSASGDEDGNGVPNLLQWAMGHDVAEADWSWRNYPATSQPFVEIDQGKLRFVIPPITRGSDLDADILVSTDGKTWTEVIGAQWEQLRNYPFSNGQDSGTYEEKMQPIAIPWPEDDSDVLLMRLRVR